MEARRKTPAEIAAVDTVIFAIKPYCTESAVAAMPGWSDRRQVTLQDGYRQPRYAGSFYAALADCWGRATANDAIEAISPKTLI